MGKLITAEELAEREGYTPRRIRQLANEERISGAQKRGRDWVFEASARILGPRTLKDLQGLIRLAPATTGAVVAGIYNQAGGVGKTTLTRDLGYLAALWGLRVLLVDMDGQGNLSKWLGVNDEVPLEQTIYPLIVEGKPLPPPVRVMELALVPASLVVDFASREVTPENLRRYDLRSLLPLDQYDLILLDTPPSVTNLLLSMLRMADRLVVPVETASKGLEGMRNVNRLLEMHRDLNPQIRVVCYIPTKYDPRAAEPRIYLDALKTAASHPVSSPVHLRVSPYTQATTDRAPVPHLYPASAATSDLIEVARFTFAKLGLEVRGG